MYHLVKYQNFATFASLIPLLFLYCSTLRQISNMMVFLPLLSSVFISTYMDIFLLLTMLLLYLMKFTIILQYLKLV